MEQPGYKIPMEYTVMRLKRDLKNELASDKVKKVLLEGLQEDVKSGKLKEEDVREEDFRDCKPEIKVEMLYRQILFGGSPFKKFEVQYTRQHTKPDGTIATTVVLTDTQFSIRKIMAVLSPQLQRIFGLFFDKTAKYTLSKILSAIATKFKEAFFAIPKLVLHAIKLIAMCLPPFTIIHKLHMDLAKAVHHLQFSLIRLPARVLRSLKRIILLPKDVYRFCGSMKSARCPAIRLRPCTLPLCCQC
jgi:hypothetical protein